MRKSRIHDGLALACAATLMSISGGALTGAAAAAPKPDHADHGKHLGQTTDPGKDHPTHGHANGDAHAPGQQANHGHGSSGDNGNSGNNGDHGNNGNIGGNGDDSGHNPPGNNGTVKIAGPGDEAGHPSNNPHPGCTLVVEWFGFDEGEDVVSSVSFSAQAPTSDVSIGGTSPAQVFVGGDPAGGGTDLDGRQAYTLTFSGGEPHPRQGYHVKLTVATPHSLGNDTKTKVFWVAPCEGEGTPTSYGSSSHHASTGGHGVEASTATAPTPADTTGTPGATSAGATGAAVPTRVDAGEDASPLPDWARSRWPLLAVAGGLTLAGAGLVRRNRARA